MGSFPEMCDDPFCSWMTGKSYAGHLEFHRIRAPASLWFFLVCSLAGCTLLLNFLLFFFNRKLFFEGGFPKEQENQTRTELNEIIQC